MNNDDKNSEIREGNKSLIKRIAESFGEEFFTRKGVARPEFIEIADYSLNTIEFVRYGIFGSRSGVFGATRVLSLVAEESSGGGLTAYVAHKAEYISSSVVDILKERNVKHRGGTPLQNVSPEVCL